MPITLGNRTFAPRLFTTLLAIVLIAMLVSLGRWQLHRAEEKRALFDAFAAGSDATHPITQQAPKFPRYGRVEAAGRYDETRQILIDNMVNAERAGYFVITPFALQSGGWVLVNRGWVPLTASRSQLPEVRFESAAGQTPTGRLDNLPVAGIALGHVPPAPGASWPQLTSFPTMADLSAALGKPLQNRQLLLNPGEPFGYVRDWHPPGLGPARHLSYAIQWWSFGALALVLYGYMNWQRGAR